MKKFLSVILALVIALSCCIFAVAEDSAPDIEALKARFVAGEGPVADGYSIDYMSYSPVGENDSTKYPLVVLLHGMTEGAEPGAQGHGRRFPACRALPRGGRPLLGKSAHSPAQGRH